MGKVSKRTVGFVIAYAFSGKDLRTGGLPGFGRKCFEDFCQIFLPMAVEFGKDLIEPETDGVRDKVLLEMFIWCFYTSAASALIRFVMFCGRVRSSEWSRGSLGGGL
ncbi:hypothetical protein, partial [Neisseria meningitidis]|uniref:hypothetical protein n=1 Tax=Neisseria meningitidis TaxID=487 RepID=UPI0021AA2B5C